MKTYIFDDSLSIIIQLFIILNHITTSNQYDKPSILTLPYINNNTGYLLSSSFGFHTTSANIIINQARNFSKIDSYPYSSQDECILRSDIITLLETEEVLKRVFECEGPINIDSFQPFIPNFHFYLASGGYPESKWIGLGLNFNDEKLSLVHFLYNTDRISHKAYGFSPSSEDNYTKGTLFLGGLPSTTKQNNKVISLQVKDKALDTWNCELKKIYLNGQEYDNKDYSYFNVNSYRTLVPLNFFDFTQKVIFDKYLKPYACILLYINRDKTYRCSPEVMNHLPKIGFGIDNYVINVELSKFFECKYKCDFIIVSNEYSKNKFIFGTSFLDLFAGSEFNYETKKILLYKKEGLFLKNQFEYMIFKTKAMKIIYLVNSSIIICFIFIFIFLKRIKYSI